MSKNVRIHENTKAKQIPSPDSNPRFTLVQVPRQTLRVTNGGTCERRFFVFPCQRFFVVFNGMKIVTEKVRREDVDPTIKRGSCCTSQRWVCKSLFFDLFRRPDDDVSTRRRTSLGKSCSAGSIGIENSPMALTVLSSERPPQPFTILLFLAMDQPPPPCMHDMPAAGWLAGWPLFVVPVVS